MLNIKKIILLRFSTEIRLILELYLNVQTIYFNGNRQEPLLTTENFIDSKTPRNLKTFRAVPIIEKLAVENLFSTFIIFPQSSFISPYRRISFSNLSLPNELVTNWCSEAHQEKMRRSASAPR
jgi:hypothetical protein